MYYLQKRSSKNEVIQFIKNNTIKYSMFCSNSGISCTIKKTKIILQKANGFFRNPFQRIFVCTVYEEKEGSTIKGCFFYRTGTLILSAFWMFFFVYNNIRAVIAIDHMSEKIIVTLFFAIFYLIIGLLFTTGKMFYKGQEKDIINFLRDIA